MSIQLLSKEQWVTHEKDVPELLKSTKDAHKRVVLDLQQITAILNKITSGTGTGQTVVLPILHPNDSTSGIFGGTNPTSIQIRIAGVTIVTIDATGLRMGP